MGIGSFFGDVASGIGRGVLGVGTLGISEMARSNNQELGQAIAGSQNPAEAISKLGQLGTPAAIQLATEIMKQQPAFNPLTPKDVLGAQTSMYTANPLMNAPPDLSGGQVQQGQPQSQGAQPQIQGGAQAQGVGIQSAAPPQTDLGSLIRSGVNGPELLSKLETLNPGVAATIKSMLSGDKKISTGMGANSGSAQVYNQLANLIDPEYSDQRYETKKAFLPQGQYGPTIASANKVINHLSTWLDAMKQLNNSDNPYVGELLNYGKNEISSIGSNPQLKGAQIAATTAGTEVAKALRQAGALNEAEQKEWQKNLTTSATPSEQPAIASKVVELLNGQLSSLNGQLKRGMGARADISQFLDPGAKANYEKLIALTGTPSALPLSQQGASAASPQTAAPAQGGNQVGGQNVPLTGLSTLPQGFKDIGGGLVEGPDGKKYQVKHR